MSKSAATRATQFFILMTFSVAIDVDPRELSDACHIISRAHMPIMASSCTTKAEYFQHLYTLGNPSPSTTDSVMDENIQWPDAVFIGDSITHEISLRYRAVGHADVVHHNNPIPSTSSVREQIIRSLPRKLVFVGGTALHHLTHKHHTHGVNIDSVNDVIAMQRERVAAVLKTLVSLQNELNITAVYVNAPVIDEPILFLDPPKGDWDDFYDFSLLKLFGYSDANLCKEHGIPLLDALFVTLNCAGIRCDGMHYGSDFKEWNCSSSISVWDNVIMKVMNEVLASNPSLKSNVEHKD